MISDDCGINTFSEYHRKMRISPISSWIENCTLTISTEPQYQIYINFTEVDCKLYPFDVFSENSEGMLLKKHNTPCPENHPDHITSVENILNIYLALSSPEQLIDQRFGGYFYSGNLKRHFIEPMSVTFTFGKFIINSREN